MTMERKQYVIRFPDGMRNQLKELARKNRRSMNAEIIMALEERLRTTAGAEFGDKTPAAAEVTNG